MATGGNAVLALCPSPELDLGHRGHPAAPSCPPSWAVRSAVAAKRTRARGRFQADHIPYHIRTIPQFADQDSREVSASWKKSHS